MFRLEEEFLASFIPYTLRDGIADKDEDTKKVDLVTLHASKGLEWDVVFLVHCNDETFPSSKKPADIICERRLFYVAVTRARKHLFFTYTKNERDLSRFVREIPSRLLMYHGLARYCLSELELGRGTPKLESLIGLLSGEDYKDLRERGILDWLDYKYIKEEILFPRGDVWSIPQWATRHDTKKDFLRFLKTFFKRLFVSKSSETSYRDPLAERLLFTLRIYSEDRPFWEKWNEELLTLLYTIFEGDAAKVPPPVDYAMMRDWTIAHEIEWSPGDLLSATSLVAKIRGQLRPLRFETYSLHEFTIGPARFVVPTELRGVILRNWRRVTDTSIPYHDCIEDIWKISALEMVGEGRNAPLYRIGEIKQNFHDPEFLSFLQGLETYFDGWIRSMVDDSQIGIEIESEWTQPDCIDLYAKGTFWQIAGEDKERISSLRLLLLALNAGFAQAQGIPVHSIGIIYPLEGRYISVRLPTNWDTTSVMIIKKAIHH